MYGVRNRYDLSHIIHAKYTPIKPPFTWFTLIVTWFYVGRLPFSPGTFGSLAAYPVYYFVIMNSESILVAQHSLYIIIAALFVIGLFAITKYQDATRTYDHMSIVLDEVIGQLLTCAIAAEWLFKLSHITSKVHGMEHYNFAFLLAFILFRFYDIYKPLFIKQIDRYSKHAFGIMCDDICAAVFAAITIFIPYWLNGLLEGIY